MMIRRGRSRLATKSATDSAGTNAPSVPCAAIIASVRAWVRLYRATAYPRLAKLRARLLPITARPTTPTWAEAGLGLVELLIRGHFPWLWSVVGLWGGRLGPASGSAGAGSPSPGPVSGSGRQGRLALRRAGRRSR